MMTYDKSNHNALSAEILKFGEEFKQISDWVQFAKEKLAVMHGIADHIGKLKSLTSGSLKDSIGMIADKVGLQDVFDVGKAIQDVATDGVELANQIKSLPAEAKAAWNHVGLSVKDVQNYLSSGLIHDAYSGLGVSSWKHVMKDPIHAMVTGELGYAIGRTESYVDASDRQRRYAEYINSLPPDQRNRDPAVLRMGFATARFGQWWDRADTRIAELLRFRAANDKLVEEAATGGKDGKDPTVIGQTQGVSGAMALNTNVSINSARNADEAAQALNAAVNAQTTIMNDRESRDAALNHGDALP